MNRQTHARSVTAIVKTLAKVGIVAVYDQGAGGFLLMKKSTPAFCEDLWNRALGAPVLVLSEEEITSPQCCEIAWRKASHLLHVEGN